MKSGFEIEKETGAKIRPKFSKIRRDGEIIADWEKSGQAPEWIERMKAVWREERIRTAALLDKRKRHTFGDDREFFVAGIEVYKNDVVVKWKPVQKMKDMEHVGGVRGKITERSGRSRKLLSFTVSNTNTVIAGMIVLTWRIAPVDGLEVKRKLGDLFDAIRRAWGKRIEWLWWLEFQKRGAPHIHILTSGAIHDELGLRTRSRMSRGKLRVREVFTGEPVKWLGEKWLRLIGEENNSASRKFTEGGIWEKMKTPDGAARYCAKDAWKPYQTKVPEKYQNVGAWWHRSRGFESPVKISELEAGEDAIRAGLKMPECKLYPVLFGKTKHLK